MRIVAVDGLRKVIRIEFPLTKHTGKARVKERASYTELGVPVATKRKPFNSNMYVEWQIGYAVELKSPQAHLSTLRESGLVFKGFNGKEKTLYELSEFLFYFNRWNVIEAKDIKALAEFIGGLSQEQLVENMFRVYKLNPTERNINGLRFLESEVKYPHLVYDFNNGFFVIAEITIREKQKAIGIQPMLFVCFPVNYLKDRERRPLLGRTARQNESGFLELGESSAFIVLECLRIFGMLSEAHRHDVLEILNLLKN